MVVNRKGRQMAAERRHVATQRRPPDPTPLLPVQTLNLFNFDRVAPPVTPLLEVVQPPSPPPAVAAGVANPTSYELTQEWREYLEPRYTFLVILRWLLPNLARVQLPLWQIPVKEFIDDDLLKKLYFDDKFVQQPLAVNASPEEKQQRAEEESERKTQQTKHVLAFFNVYQIANLSAQEQMLAQVRCATASHLHAILRRALTTAGVTEKQLSTTALAVLLSGPESIDVIIQKQMWIIFVENLEAICSGLKTCESFEFPDRGPTSEQLAIAAEIDARHGVNVQYNINYGAAGGGLRPTRPRSPTGHHGGGGGGGGPSPSGGGGGPSPSGGLWNAGGTSGSHSSNPVDAIDSKYFDSDDIVEVMAYVFNDIDEPMLGLMVMCNTGMTRMRNEANPNQDHMYILEILLKVGDAIREEWKSKVIDIIQRTREGVDTAEVKRERRKQMYTEAYPGFNRSYVSYRKAVAYYAAEHAGVRAHLIENFAFTDADFVNPSVPDDEFQQHMRKLLAAPEAEAAAAANQRNGGDPSAAEEAERKRLIDIASAEDLARARQHAQDANSNPPPPKGILFEYTAGDAYTWHNHGRPSGYIRMSSLLFALPTAPELSPPGYPLEAAGSTRQERVNQFLALCKNVIEKYALQNVTDMTTATSALGITEEDLGQMSDAFSIRHIKSTFGSRNQLRFDATFKSLAQLPTKNAEFQGLRTKITDAHSNLGRWCEFLKMKVNASFIQDDCEPKLTTVRAGAATPFTFSDAEKQQWGDFVRHHEQTNTQKIQELGTLTARMVACMEVHKAAVKVITDVNPPMDTVFDAFEEQKTGTKKQLRDLADRTFDIRATVVANRRLLLALPADTNRVLADVVRLRDRIKRTPAVAKHVNWNFQGDANQVPVADEPKFLNDLSASAKALIAAANSHFEQYTLHVPRALNELRDSLTGICKNITFNVIQVYNPTLAAWKSEIAAIEAFNASITDDQQNSRKEVIRRATNIQTTCQILLEAIAAEPNSKKPERSGTSHNAQNTAPKRPEDRSVLECERRWVEYEAEFTKHEKAFSTSSVGLNKCAAAVIATFEKLNTYLKGIGIKQQVPVNAQSAQVAGDVAKTLLATTAKQQIDAYRLAYSEWRATHKDLEKLFGIINGYVIGKTHFQQIAFEYINWFDRDHMTKISARMEAIKQQMSDFTELHNIVSACANVWKQLHPADKASVAAPLRTQASGALTSIDELGAGFFRRMSQFNDDCADAIWDSDIFQSKATKPEAPAPLEAELEFQGNSGDDVHDDSGGGGGHESPDKPPSTHGPSASHQTGQSSAPSDSLPPGRGVQVMLKILPNLRTQDLMPSPQSRKDNTRAIPAFSKDDPARSIDVFLQHCFGDINLEPTHPAAAAAAAGVNPSFDGEADATAAAAAAAELTELKRRIATNNARMQDIRNVRGGAPYLYELSKDLMRICLVANKVQGDAKLSDVQEQELKQMFQDDPQQLPKSFRPGKDSDLCYKIGRSEGYVSTKHPELWNQSVYVAAKLRKTFRMQVERAKAQLDAAETASALSPPTQRERSMHIENSARAALEAAEKRWAFIRWELSLLLAHPAQLTDANIAKAKKGQDDW